jgi:acyl carrier protein
MPDDRPSEELAFHLDDFSMLVLGMRLQREFGVHLRGRDFDECRTVGDVVRIVAAKYGN